jgi:hypothetical protein
MGREEMTGSGCQDFVRLSNDLKSRADLEKYSDENWCENYTADEYFLYILCWAGWRIERQKKVWQDVRNRFGTFSKELRAFQPIDVQELGRAYPLPWQKVWLQRLVDYLVKNSLSAQMFVGILKTMGYENARDKLQGIMETDCEKIVDCWLRDIVRLDAFPIDTRIRGLLRKYGMPEDSNFIIQCCRRNNIPVKSFARALYDNAEKLKQCK